MKLTRTQHGLNWDDMELTCLFDDGQGRVFLRIKRGKKTHELYVTKTGKLVVSDVSKKVSNMGASASGTTESPNEVGADKGLERVT